MNENTVRNEVAAVKMKPGRMFLRGLLVTGQGVRDGITYTVEDGEGNDLKAFAAKLGAAEASGYTGPTLHAIRWLAKRIDPTLRVLGVILNENIGRCTICEAAVWPGVGRVCEHYLTHRGGIAIVAETVRDVWVLIDRDDQVRAAEAHVSALNGCALDLSLATEHNEYDHGTYRTYVSLDTGVRVDCVSVPARACCDCHGLLIEHVGCPGCDGEIPWGEVQTRHDLFTLGDGLLCPNEVMK